MPVSGIEIFTHLPVASFDWVAYCDKPNAAALAADRMTINAVHSNRNFNIVRISFLY